MPDVIIRVFDRHRLTDSQLGDERSPSQLVEDVTWKTVYMSQFPRPPLSVAKIRDLGQLSPALIASRADRRRASLAP